MKYTIRFFVIVLLIGKLCASDDGFYLMTVLYNETNSERCAEYKACFERNLAHPLIKHITVIYDTSKNDGVNELLSYLQHKPVSLYYVDARPTYGLCFQLAHQQYKQGKIILSNADIYFNHTLALLLSYNLKNKLLALTRWNVLNDKTLALYCTTQGVKAEFSQDTWIFELPLKTFYDDILLGMPHCDGRIAYEAQKAGLCVLNPCLTVQCCHMHLSAIRNYDKYGPYKRDASCSIVPWSTLTECQ